MKQELLLNEFLRFKQATSYRRLEAYKKEKLVKEVDLLSIYLWNIALSEALYPVLYNFEIALRNSLDQAISRLFGQDWLDRKNSQILCDKEIASVDSAKDNLRKKNKILSPRNIISELSLGFWVSLSYAEYEKKDKLYPKLFCDQDFLPHLPRSQRTRRTLSAKLELVRRLRNKIFHHTPIYNDDNLKQGYEDALAVIEWISPILLDVTQKLCRFQDIYSQGYATYNMDYLNVCYRESLQNETPSTEGTNEEKS